MRSRTETYSRPIPRGRPTAYSGMLPCFFGGLLSRLANRVCNADIRRGLVSRGSITSSRNPREAA